MDTGDVELVRHEIRTATGYRLEALEEFQRSLDVDSLMETIAFLKEYYEGLVRAADEARVAAETAAAEAEAAAADAIAAKDAAEDAEDGADEAADDLPPEDLGGGDDEVPELAPPPKDDTSPARGGFWRKWA